MIPKSSGDASAPESNGAIQFHLVIDDFKRGFSVDGPETNAMRLHYEVMGASRQPNRKLRELELRAESVEAVVALMEEHFPGYAYLGPWKK